MMLSLGQLTEDWQLTEDSHYKYLIHYKVVAESCESINFEQKQFDLHLI